MKMRLLPNKKKILKSYSFLSMLGNFLIALSISGLAVLGVLSSDIAFPLLAGLAISFGLFGLVGRFIDQSIEDIEDAAE
jgi:small-conductance mechanosensitive channel